VNAVVVSTMLDFVEVFVPFLNIETLDIKLIFQAYILFLIYFMDMRRIF